MGFIRSILVLMSASTEIRLYPRSYPLSFLISLCLASQNLFRLGGPERRPTHTNQRPFKNSTLLASTEKTRSEQGRRATRSLWLSLESSESLIDSRLLCELRWSTPSITSCPRIGNLKPSKHARIRNFRKTIKKEQKIEITKSQTKWSPAFRLTVSRLDRRMISGHSHNRAACEIVD